MMVHGWELLTSAVHEGEFVFAAKNLPMARSAPAPWIADLWSVLNRGLPKRLSPLLKDRFLSRYTLDELMEALERPYEVYLEGLVEAAKVSLKWQGSLSVGLAKYHAEIDSLVEDDAV